MGEPERRKAFERLGALPDVGDEIYVPSAWYLSHGSDDFQGGLATVSAVEVRKGGSLYVEVQERPGCKYSWIGLREKQEELRERFGDDKAHPDPDNHPDANRWD